MPLHVQILVDISYYLCLAAQYINWTVISTFLRFDEASFFNTIHDHGDCE